MASTMVSTAAAETNIPLPSCEGCRRRKLKCSRDKPACTNCKRLDSTCEYDPNKNKPGIKSGVVDQLTRRIEDLEHKLYEDDGDEQRRTSPVSLAGPTRTHAGSGDASSPALGGALSTLAQEIQKLSSNVTVLATAMASQSQCNMYSANTAHVDADRGQKRPRLDDATIPIARTPLPESASKRREENPLKGDHLDALMNVYFSSAARWIPLVHETTFKRMLRERGADSEPWPIVLHAILVAALPILNAKQQLFSTDHVRSMVALARSKVLLTASERLTIEHLQSLVIIAFTHLGDGEHRKAWPLIGLLTRSADYLQLGVEEEERVAPTGLLALGLPPASADWIEEETRRRVFWNIFMLDRLCSITAGCKISLTGENVWRRLPLCGTRWNTDHQATSPYFGIWDRATAKIGNSVAFIPEHYPSPEQSTAGSSNGLGENYTAATSNQVGTGASPSAAAIDMSTVGAFAYYVESVESLCRVNEYFLQQDCDFSNRSQVSSWLTRFKELDRRLVDWKLFLPVKWRDPTIPPAETGVMDPNMTLAHVTHNTSMILLHQRIGYFGMQFKNYKLPSLYSAETCRLAAVETATITKEYLAVSSPYMPLSPNFSFCLCISARVLLVHCQYYGEELDPHFWALIEALEEGSRRWFRADCDGQSVCLAESFAIQLRQLHRELQENPNYRLDVQGSPSPQGSFAGQRGGIRRSQSRLLFSCDPSSRLDNSLPTLGQVSMLHNGVAVPQFDFSALIHHHDSNTTPGTAKIDVPTSGQVDGMPNQAPEDADDLANLLDFFGDQSFTNLDRIISYAEINPSMSELGGGLNES